MEAPDFLFFGYGAEYSLRPLAQYLEKMGDNCIEIDMLHSDNVVRKLQSLEGRSIVFITSAHILYDTRNFFYYRTDREIVSALHVISTLQPIVSVYYPHDYKDPIKTEEISYLSLFDLVLWPFTKFNDDISALVKVTPVGWIKSGDIPETFAEVQNPGQAVFFIGAFQYYLNAGVERFYADFRVLFEAGVALKLPVWHDTEGFEAYLAARGVKIYASASNSIEVMRANKVIITHALSSVGFEACDIGKSVIYIKDSVFDYADPVEAFRGRGSVAFADTPAEAVSLFAGELPVNDAAMLSFDFNAAYNAIWGEYKAKHNP